MMNGREDLHSRTQTRTLPAIKYLPDPAPDSALTLRWLLVVVCAFYGITWCILRMFGRTPAVPWLFLPFLLLVSLPLALCTVAALGVLPSRSARSAPTPQKLLLCIAASLVLIVWSTESLVWVSGTIGFLAVTARVWSVSRLKTLLTALIIMIVGYAGIWNVNYIGGVLSIGRLNDQALIAMDLSVIQFFSGKVSGYSALFPLVRQPWLFDVLEKSYALLFSQVLSVIIVFSATRPPSQAARVIATLFAGYLLGLGVFVVFPAVGPPIFQPDSLDSSYSTTLTGLLMASMAREYRQLSSGGPLAGFGYFVALPSLHVAASVFLQSVMRPWPLLFWTWLPVTVLLCLSTVLLGYHYLIDVPTGFLLAILMVRWLKAGSDREDAHNIPAEVFFPNARVPHTD